jgi:hypothetical protein
MALVTLIGLVLLVAVVGMFAVVFGFIQRHVHKGSPKFL